VYGVFRRSRLLDTVREHVESRGFQFKNGAAFLCGQKRSHYNFTEKFTDGPGTTWQVRRADFDHLLAQQAQQYGADVRFGHEVIAVDVASEQPILTVLDESHNNIKFKPSFYWMRVALGEFCRSS
jgi:flavin-dependent dehydrogenase